MNVVSFGGGTNSTAMLIGLRDRGIKVDLILFADPGSERQHTYKHVDQVDKWLVENNMPKITRVKRMWREDGEKTLYEECIEKNILPSIAYGGFKTCSINYKIRPQEKYLNNLDECKKIWKSGEMVNRYIGYDFGEPSRRENARKYDRVEKKYHNIYPMVDDWEWSREDCVKVIKREGLELPGKSSCFFCPNMRPIEVLELYREDNEDFERALFMESNADLTKLDGLGRQWAWREFIEMFINVEAHHEGKTDEELIDIVKALMKDVKKQSKNQMSLCDFMEGSDAPCGCYD